MDTLTFLVTGSAAEPYRVEFSKRSGLLVATCTCAAASNGQACKHRIDLAIGNAVAYADGDMSKISLLSEWLQETEISSALSDVNEAEQRVDAAKKNLAAAKKRLSAAFLGKSISGK